MFVLHWTSHCSSKLNTEVPLLYFLPFHEPTTPFGLAFVFPVEEQDSSGTVPSLRAWVRLSSVASALRAPPPPPRVAPLVSATRNVCIAQNKKEVFFPA